MSRGVSHACGSIWKFYFTAYHAADDFEWFIEDLQYIFKQKYKSLTECDLWLGREDHAILANSHAYIGISEYNGIVCLWCVPKNSNMGYPEDNLHLNWCDQIYKNISKMLIKNYPESMLINRGSASNGEQFFTPANRPDGVVTSKEGVVF